MADSSLHTNRDRPDSFDAELGRRVEELSRAAGITPRKLLRAAVEKFAADRKPAKAVGETALGKRLRAIRKKIERSGVRLLTAAEIDHGLAAGRRAARNGS